VRQLSNDQIRAVFTGKVRNWRELGGADVPITVVNKAEGRSTLELFLEYFGLRNSQIAADVIIGDNQQGLKTVAGNRGAIGYVSIGAAEYEAARGVPIRQLSMQGIEASVENVRAGRYPLSRPLNLILWSSPRGMVLDYINFARSSAVDDLIERQFFVPPSR
ncbi:MAG: substrate-binding domain-containing protein, partial [Pseudohongiellaceae bacterium]